MTRKYDMKRRSERQEETRRRIVEATVGLHETVGMARTTISAIAEKAGVQRLTVYRHFPDERALFSACSAHWGATNPPPDPASWTQISDPEERLRVALMEVYAFQTWRSLVREQGLDDEQAIELMARCAAGVVGSP